MPKLLSTLLLLVVIVSLMCVCGCADNPATKCTPPDIKNKISALSLVDNDNYYSRGDGTFAYDYFRDENGTKYVASTNFRNILYANPVVEKYKISYFCNEYGYYQIAKLTPVDDLK